MRTLKILVLAVLLTVGAIQLIERVFFPWDGCLDQGGRWLYDTKSCDFG